MRVFLLLLIATVGSVLGHVPTLFCSTTHRKPLECVLENLRVPREVETYNVASRQPNTTAVEVTNSTLAIVSSDFCRAFSKLGMFVAKQQGVEAVTAGAFSNCHSLFYVDLDRNSIKVLPENLFFNSTRLQNVHISYNRIQHIPEILLESNYEVFYLFLDNNDISYLSAEALRNNSALQYVSLESNELVDFDANQVLRNKPRFNSVSISGNLIPCGRLQGIVEVFQRAKVIVRPEVNEPKERRYTMSSVQNVTCVATWFN